MFLRHPGENRGLLSWVRSNERRVRACAEMAIQCLIVGGTGRPQHRRRRLGSGGAALAFLVERMAKTADNEAAHGSRIAKSHFRLGRVDVDVDLVERDFEEQSGDRMTVAGEQV